MLRTASSSRASFSICSINTQQQHLHATRTALVCRIFSHFSQVCKSPLYTKTKENIVSIQKTVDFMYDKHVVLLHQNARLETSLNSSFWGRSLPGPQYGLCPLQPLWGLSALPSVNSWIRHCRWWRLAVSRLSPQRPSWTESMTVCIFFGVVYCVNVCFCPRPYTFHTPMARYSIFALKVP